jgi:YesN/AraC family two-component response regulator
VKNNFKNSVSLATRRQIRKIFDIMRLDKGSGEIDREVANCRLMNILVLLYREVCFSDKTYSVENDTDSATLRHHKLVAEAQKYIEKNYATPLTLQVIADHLQVSSFYLSRIFSRESEFCLSGYLTSVRISAAEKLLKEGRYIVSDVAGMVGYENSGYFSRVFKKHTGMSPKMYQLNQ